MKKTHKKAECKPLAPRNIGSKAQLGTPGRDITFSHSGSFGFGKNAQQRLGARKAADHK